MDKEKESRASYIWIFHSWFTPIFPLSLSISMHLRKDLLTTPFFYSHDFLLNVPWRLRTYEWVDCHQQKKTAHQNSSGIVLKIVRKTLTQRTTSIGMVIINNLKFFFYISLAVVKCFDRSNHSQQIAFKSTAVSESKEGG